LNKYFKGIFLTATLLIPVVIFLFLKFFGENKFDIPVFYQDGVPHTFENCEFPEDSQYIIKDSAVNGPKCYVFVTDNTGLNRVKNIKQRINQSVGKLNIKIFTSDSTQIKGDELSILSKEELKRKLNCAFASDTLDQIILVDKRRRIRGYYRFNREEVDRLIVESKILTDNEQTLN